MAEIIPKKLLRVSFKQNYKMSLGQSQLIQSYRAVGPRKLLFLYGFTTAYGKQTLLRPHKKWPTQVQFQVRNS